MLCFLFHIDISKWDCINLSLSSLQRNFVGYDQPGIALQPWREKRERESTNASISWKYKYNCRINKFVPYNANYSSFNFFFTNNLHIIYLSIIILKPTELLWKPIMDAPFHLHTLRSDTNNNIAHLRTQTTDHIYHHSLLSYIQDDNNGMSCKHKSQNEKK